MSLLGVVWIFLNPSAVLCNHLILAGGLAVTLHSMVRVSSSLGVELLPSMSRLGSTTELRSGCNLYQFSKCNLLNTLTVLSAWITSLPPLTIHM